MEDSQEDEFLAHVTVLAEGNLDGVPWSLMGGFHRGTYMYGLRTPYGGSSLPIRLPHSGEPGRLLGYFGTHDRGGWGGPSPGGHDLVIRYTAGAVDPTVAAVRVLGPNEDSAVDARVVRFDENVAFFAAVYGPWLTPEWVVAYDDEGDELDRHTLRRLMT